MSKKTNVIDLPAKINREETELRIAAINLTTRIFAETPFANMLGRTTPADAKSEVSDVPFYNVADEIYSFLKNGKFKGFEDFKLARAKIDSLNRTEA